MTRASIAIRIFLFLLAAMIMVGIWLTGFETVHWFSYVIPAFLLFAAATGICPGLIITQKLFGTDRTT